MSEKLKMFDRKYKVSFKDLSTTTLFVLKKQTVEKVAKETVLSSRDFKKFVIWNYAYYKKSSVW